MPRPSRQQKRARSLDIAPRFEAFAVALTGEVPRLRIETDIGKLEELGGSKLKALCSGLGPSGTRAAQLTLRRGQKISVGEAWELARTISLLKGVRYAEPLFIGPGVEPTLGALAPHERPRRPAAKGIGGGKDDPCSASLTWSLDMIRATQAWALSPAPGGKVFGEGIRVGHPDTGYLKHPEIWEVPEPLRRVFPEAGYDFKKNKNDPVDPIEDRNDHGHGTATASVIMSARAAANENTVVGTAPQSSLVPLRVAEGVIHLSFANLTRAIYHAVDTAHSDVISMSLGGPLRSKALEDAIDYAIGRGVIVLAAAGNVWPWVVYPARFSQVIAVAACNCRRQPWSKSASGNAVDITAPGESVWRAVSKRTGGAVQFDIARSSGTSYAVATAAGACAAWLAFHGRDKLRAQYGSKLAQVFRQVLVTHGFTRPDGWDTAKYGVGILDMERLLRAPMPPGPPDSKSRKRGAKSVRRPPPGNPDVAIAGYFPGLPVAKVQRAVASLLATGPGAKSAGRTALLLEPELAFHIATNPRLRSWLHARASAPSAAKSKSRRALPRPPLPTASRTLKRLLNAGA